MTAHRRVKEHACCACPPAHPQAEGVNSATGMALLAARPGAPLRPGMLGSATTTAPGKVNITLPVRNFREQVRSVLWGEGRGGAPGKVNITLPVRNFREQVRSVLWGKGRGGAPGKVNITLPVRTSREQVRVALVWAPGRLGVRGAARWHRPTLAASGRRLASPREKLHARAWRARP